MTKEQMKEMGRKRTVRRVADALGNVLFAFLSIQIIIWMGYYAKEVEVPYSVSALLNGITISAALVYSVWRFVLYFWSKRGGWPLKLESLIVSTIVGYFTYRFLLAEGSWIIVAGAIFFGILAGILDMKVLGKEEFMEPIVPVGTVFTMPEPELEETGA